MLSPFYLDLMTLRIIGVIGQYVHTLVTSYVEEYLSEISERGLAASYSDNSFASSSPQLPTGLHVFMMVSRAFILKIWGLQIMKPEACYGVRHGDAEYLLLHS